MLKLSVEDAPQTPDLDVVDAGLHRYNREHGSVDEVGRLAVFARDSADAVRGGAVGRYWGRCGELQQLWVDEALRRGGVGTQLLAAFERHAAGLGCRVVYLDTFSFQAPAFYRQRGYAEILRQDGFPHGHVKYTMRKALAF